MNSEQTVTAGQFAAIFGVNITTVRRWVSNGQLRAYRLPGGQFRIPIGEVDRIRRPVEATGSGATESSA